MFAALEMFRVVLIEIALADVTGACTGTFHACRRRVFKIFTPLDNFGYGSLVCGSDLRARHL